MYDVIRLWVAMLYELIHNSMLRQLLFFILLYTDINECIDPSSCGQWGTCANLEGSYSCECPDGFSLNEDKICEGML